MRPVVAVGLRAIDEGAVAPVYPIAENVEAVSAGVSDHLLSRSVGANLISCVVGEIIQPFILLGDDSANVEHVLHLVAEFIGVPRTIVRNERARHRRGCRGG